MSLVAGINLHVIYLAQDDRKKNTAIKLSRNGLIKLHESLHALPRKGVILNPICGKVLGPEDHEILRSGGALTALDCSWRLLDESLEGISKRTRLKHRALPVLLAANPVNWGKPGLLSTAEALAASLYLMKFYDQATQLLERFNWGSRFFELNEEPLATYAECNTSEELVDAQFLYFDRPE